MKRRKRRAKKPPIRKEYLKRVAHDPTYRVRGETIHFYPKSSVREARIRLAKARNERRKRTRSLIKRFFG